MNRRILTAIAFAVLIASTSSMVFARAPERLSDSERTNREKEVAALEFQLQKTRPKKSLSEQDLWADAAVFRKAVVWAMMYEEMLGPADVTLIQSALKRGNERAIAFAEGKQTWASRKGKVIRGFISMIDGSIQPYGVIVPAGYDSAKPTRLDVVLHGSSKPRGLSELQFMNRFDEGDAAAKSAPDQNFIELHPLGRVENCYRWAGETDVFEAIEATCRQYKIDRDRIVLRGMSMGASGTWHLGLKHPDQFVALGPYCGYVDTHEFSQTALPNFIKVGPLPEYQEKALHMLDSIDYAANAGVVPAIACMGDKDVFFQAHVLMGKTMEKEGLRMVNLISKGTGHVIDPVTHAEQMRQIGQYAEKGLDHSPKHVRFVTWTVKYDRCHWLRVLGMEEHYRRAELDATVGEDGTIDVKEPKNITRFALSPVALQKSKPRLRVGGVEVPIPDREKSTPAQEAVFVKQDGKWAYLGEMDSVPLPGKRPGLQGPIDDAFAAPFLCVRGTGKAWNPAIQTWADDNLKRFEYEWHRYFRGELPVKDDVEVTADDIRHKNLILFGDPGSNSLIARVLPKLPIEWTAKWVRFGDERYAAADHAPVLIQPNPLTDGRYVVINSGHTFHEKELNALNYLLFPRLGDWAMMKVDGKATAKPSDPIGEEVMMAGYFDEQWRFRKR